MRFLLPTLIIYVISGYSHPTKNNIVVIGGGAAGYFAAVECANFLKMNSISSHNIILLESGPNPLSKVLISGGGRCNVMHDPNKGPKEISKGYPRGQKELLGPLSKKFTPTGLT